VSTRRNGEVSEAMIASQPLDLNGVPWALVFECTTYANVKTCKPTPFILLGSFLPFFFSYQYKDIATVALPSPSVVALVVYTEYESFMMMASLF
jgi:hypothetical protein